MTAIAPEAGELLERSDELAALDESLAAIRSGRGGRLVLVGGEAGIGKTALVRAFCERSDLRVLWGACDALHTPRPLGPLLDLADQAGGELAALAEEGTSPASLVAALTKELRRRPAIVVLEDLHWSDEATLDVLRLLVRRIEGLHALVLATYRDELERDHGLRIVLGEVGASRGVTATRRQAPSRSRRHRAAADGALAARVPGSRGFRSVGGVCRLGDAARRRRRRRLPTRDRTDRDRGHAAARPRAGPAPRGARRPGRSRRRSRAARTPRRGRRRRGGSPSPRPGRGRAGRRARRPPRGGRAVRARAALLRRADSRAPRPPARAPLVRVLPHGPHRRGDRGPQARARRARPRGQSPARGRRAPLALAPGVVHR